MVSPAAITSAARRARALAVAEALAIAISGRLDVVGAWPAVILDGPLLELPHGFSAHRRPVSGAALLLEPGSVTWVTGVVRRTPKLLRRYLPAQQSAPAGRR